MCIWEKGELEKNWPHLLHLPAEPFASPKVLLAKEEDYFTQHPPAHCSFLFSRSPEPWQWLFIGLFRLLGKDG